MSNARIEEVSDSESDVSDPSEGDLDDFTEADILRQRDPVSSKPSSALVAPSAPAPSQNRPGPPAFDPKEAHDWPCLYPIYFDSSRTRAEGRRVSASLAVKNPLAREIANACSQLRITPFFEPAKTHPQDWANPGRVRVNLRDPDNPFARQVKNKHHLYVLVAKHLQANPTTDDAASLRRINQEFIPYLTGIPKDNEPWPKPAVPRGWKMNEFLPIYSSAMSGGGVSENALRDMMQQMGAGMGGGPGGDMMSMLQGAGGPSGGQGPSGNEGGTKKIKKGKGK